MLSRKLAAVGFGDQPAFGNADQRVMRVVIVALGEERLVGGNERDAAGIGEPDQRRLDGALGRGAVPLQFDIEPVAIDACEGLAARRGKLALPGGNRGIDRTGRTAGERNQAIARVLEPVEAQMRLFVGRRFKESAGAKPHQAAIAGLALRDQHDARQDPDTAVEPRVARLVGEIDGERAADDRLDAG